MIFEVTHHLGPYMILISLLFTVAAIYGCGYLFNQSSNRHSIRKPAHETEHLYQLSSQRMLNEKIDAIQSWITMQTRRKESPDDQPSHILLATFIKNEKSQGGFIWKRKLHSSHGVLY